MGTEQRRRSGRLLLPPVNAAAERLGLGDGDRLAALPPEVVELEPVELELELEARSKVQGTATCLPELDELEIPEVELVLELELLVPELPELPELFRDRIAKSTLPEVGLMTTS